MKRFSGPDLIGVGLPKAGTTWLYQILLNNGSIQKLPFKEITYLSRLDNSPFGFFKRLFSNEKHFIAERKRIKRYIHTLVKKHSPIKVAKDSLWISKFFLLPRTIGNYKRLFPSTISNQLNVDISPIYWGLPENTIKLISKEFPEAKIMIMLREPISRAFSHAKMRLIKKDPEDLYHLITDDNLYNEYLSVPQFFNDYVGGVELWKKYFDGRNFICFYEELESDPFGLFGRICDFAGIPNNLKKEDLKVRYNAGRQLEMSVELEKKFALLYKPYISDIHQYFQNSYTQEWLNYHNNLTQ